MQRRAEYVRREIIRLCHAGLDSHTLRVETLKQLHKVIPIDVSFFATADPATLLFTGAVQDEILGQVTPQFLENEFLRDDVNKFVWLARNTPPIGGLVQATGGACWGFMCLHRDRSSPPFTAGEAAFLARLTPHLAEGLRKAMLISATTRAALPDEPGLLLLAEDLSLAAITPTAERWLAEVAAADLPGTQHALMYAVAAAARLQALERASDVQPDLLPKVRLRTASGHWLVLHASRLSGPSAGGQIAVIVEAARPAEVAPLIVQAYDLTKRESEILQLVVRGHSTAEIAATLHISANTVQDHLKAIFEKVGVRSRRELAGQLFAQQYQPRIVSGRNLDSNGWFT